MFIFKLFMAVFDLKCSFLRESQTSFVHICVCVLSVIQWKICKNVLYRRAGTSLFNIIRLVITIS